MSVWFCIPSARPVKEANQSLSKWRERGYRVGLWRDTEPAPELLCDLLLTGRYPGYANAVNAIAGEVLKIDPECRWIVDGGDDTEPDANHDPETIATECESHFGGTFGVMQPTGDRWGEQQGSAYAERVAGSPWIGRRFCETVNGGNGPLWHEYFHMGVDEELQAVAIKLGAFWQRQDLSHFHRHWARGQHEIAPAFLAKANSPQEWEKYKRLFHSRQAAGFPGHQPIEVHA